LLRSPRSIRFRWQPGPSATKGRIRPQVSINRRRRAPLACA
jgi:hypothetical protein